MRLTLRTLLAYLDDVLDPVDKEELAQKIESSDFAEDLVHRTRDTVRRLRLSAPQVIGAGMGLDPNTVAEYLDNVMPPEQVGDFERICLESDVHLAEATACHHVLTMILGEPADIDPIVRQRMHTIATEAGNRRQLRMEAAHVPAAGAAVTAAPIQPVAVPSSRVAYPRSAEIPEYLRARSWWRSTSVLFGLAAIVVIGTTIVFASSLRGWIGNNSTVEPLGAQNSAPPLDTNASNNSMVAPPVLETNPPTTGTAKTEIPSGAGLANPPQPQTPGMIPPAASAAAPAANNGASTAAETDRYTVRPTEPVLPSTPAPSNELATAQPVTPNDVAPNTLPATTPGEPAAGNAESTVVANAPPLPPPSSTPVPTDIAASPPLLPPATPAAQPAVNELASSTPAAGLGTAPPAVPETNDAQAQPGTVPTAVPDAGTYLGGKTVLLRHDHKKGAWFRVEPRSAVVPGERLLSLPEFRPTIALVSGIQVNLAGGTQVIMDGANEPGAGNDSAPSLEVVYGRIVLINPTNSEKRLRLQLGPHKSVAKLNHNTTLAIEVERKHVPGNDPRTMPSPVEVRIYAPEGGVGWSDTGGDRDVAAPSRWTLGENGAADVIADAAPPEWIDHEPVGQVSEQRFGAPVIESTLVSNVPAADQLLALYKGESRREVKSLVARSSIHVDLFQPFIEALRDSEQKANWKSHIETLRAAMALSPDSAKRVYQALVDKREKSAADLYEMLCGYNAEQIGQTPEEVKNGAIAKLINWLEDDSLDYRVLAVQDLSEITGKTLMPNPAAKLADRAQSIRRWRARLEGGELQPVAPAKGQ